MGHPPSPALLGFGGDSAVELLSATIVLRRFCFASRQEHGEQKAAKIAGALLFILATFVVLASALSLLGHVEPQPTAVGIAVLVVARTSAPRIWYTRPRCAAANPSKALQR